MVEPVKNKVNRFAPGGLPEETSLSARLQGLNCLLRLGRLIDGEDQVEMVGAQVPEILIEGLGEGETFGVHLTLGSYVFQLGELEHGHSVYRKKILSKQSPVGEVEVFSLGAQPMSADQVDLVDAVAERLGRFFERKGLQSALQLSQERYKHLFQQARDGIVLVDAETGIILDANVSFLDLVGQGLDQLHARKVWELVAPERRERFQAEFERSVLKGESQWMALPVVAPVKGTLELEVSGSLVRFADHPVLQFICRDITDRLRLTRRFAESELRYRAIFDSTPVAMVSCDLGGIVLDVNACLLTRFYHDQMGKPQLVGRHVLDLGLCDLGERREDFLSFLNGVCVQLREVPIVESSYRPAGYANIRCTPLMDSHGAVKGGVIIIEDITEMREAQRAMMQSAKMAAVGQMTSGFAHELGTPLGIISANAQYLLQECGSTSLTTGGAEKGAEELRVILSETNRITNLIQQLLIFSRPAKFDRVPTSVNDLLHEVLALLANQQIMRSIEVETHLSPEVAPLPLEPTLIKQVFLNLVINACQAMPDGGKLTVGSRMVRLRSPLEDRLRTPHVEVSLADTGVGISQSDLRRIFTPFFTTKDVGKGTGLGLSVSYRIVQNHGGRITAESPGEGQGATFRIYLPLSGPRKGHEDTPFDEVRTWGKGMTHG